MMMRLLLVCCTAAQLLHLLNKQHKNKAYQVPRKQKFATYTCISTPCFSLMVHARLHYNVYVTEESRKTSSRVILQTHKHTNSQQ